MRGVPALILAGVGRHLCRHKNDQEGVLTTPTTDQFNVTGAWDKPSYAAGDTITGTISGGDVQTTTTSETVGPVTVPIVAADGATSTVEFSPVTVTKTTATPESVTIDTTRPIVDNGANPRTWVVSANLLSITATA